MKENLIGWLRMKESRNKRNNNKNGKKEKKQDWTCCIKFMMTEREKLETIKRPSKSNWEKSNRINWKLSAELKSMKLCNKLVVRLIINVQSKINANSFNKLLKSKSDEEWSSCNFKKRSNSSRMLDNNTHKR